ncbi:MAG: YybH family protein [Gemmatimonadaceae bacterium]
MRAAHRLTAAAAAALTVACATAAPAPSASDRDAARREIDAMMSAAARNWTHGDLDAFVSDYMPGEGTTYIGGQNRVLRGPDAIRASYAPRFAPGAARDSLSFERTEVDLLAPGVAHVISFYKLTRGDSVTGYGPTSLVMRRDADGRWRIVHDHSS